MGVITSAISYLIWLLAKNITLFLIFTIIFLIAKFLLNDRHKRSPPGPWGLPIIGYLPFLGAAAHETLHKLSRKYGSVMQISFGLENVVVISDPEVIRQTFKKQVLTGRPVNSLYDMFQGYGVINSTGDRWKEQRRFLHEHLRALGMKVFGPGRDQMETRIMKEVQNCLQSLDKHNGEPADVDSYLKKASANVVCDVLMSETFELDNPIFKRLLTLHQEGFQLFVKANLGNYVPIFKYTSVVQESTKQLCENRNESLSLIKEFVKKRREIFDPETTRDIIDAYLHEEYNTKLEGKPVDHTYDHQLMQVICDLFSAGQETVNHCLNWCLIYLVHNKDVLRKVQEELDRVVGRARLPSLDDTPHLPYTEATISEVLRKSNIVPLATPHSTTTDTYIDKYFIPKGTTVFANLYSCHMDDKYWSNPDTFDPTRFLDSNGKFVKPKEFMPFGVGRRMCLGEVMARSEVFLFITSMIHRFDLELPLTDQPTFKATYAVAAVPEAYKIRFIPRKTDQELIASESTTSLSSRCL